MVMRERPLKRDHNWQNYENTDGDRPGYEKENIGGEDEGGKPEARRRGGCLCFEFLVLVSNHSEHCWWRWWWWGWWHSPCQGRQRLQCRRAERGSPRRLQQFSSPGSQTSSPFSFKLCFDFFMNLFVFVPEVWIIFHGINILYMLQVKWTIL